MNSLMTSSRPCGQSIAKCICGLYQRKGATGTPSDYPDYPEADPRFRGRPSGRLVFGENSAVLGALCWYDALPVAAAAPPSHQAFPTDALGEFEKIRNYSEENPVRAGLVREASEYRWPGAGWATGAVLSPFRRT